ncbi:hypothetical protein FrEUN1fDRAFT_4841 [Parafrankia sp. EUN1f]|nr:hypothetical protein FrEUN1fDRAFT_4841 [Parafrankia sp. EUN1f]
MVGATGWLIAAGCSAGRIVVNALAVFFRLY